jgi:5-methylcytosine-specific restriction endonuclease McrA
VIKFCKRCNVETERYKCGDCKPCKAAWYAVNKEKALARNAVWHAENRELANARSSAWHAANREKSLASKLAWYSANREKELAARSDRYAANREKAKAKSLAWTAANPERHAKNRAAWNAANPEKRRIHKQNRLSQKRANGGKLSSDLSAKLFKLQRGKCACCGLPLGDNYHLDHIMPIALGGANEDSNIQLLRQRCNNQKHAKHPVDFMQSRGFLL